jgi:hypothetical protein
MDRSWQTNEQKRRAILRLARVPRFGGFTAFAICHLVLLLTGLLQPHASHAVTDSTSYELREFDEQKMEEYRNNPDFDYEREDLNLSWWERFTKWLRDLFRDVDPDMPDIDPGVKAPNLAWLSALGNVLLILLVAALIAGIVFLIVKGSGKMFRRGAKAEEEDIVAEESEENINDLPIDDMLQSAIDGRQWRTAVRILYLRSLKALSDNGQIHWESQKTNYDYLREVQAPELKSPFRDLTLLFENIWYGEYPVDQNIFHTANESFSAFDRQIRRKS